LGDKWGENLIVDAVFEGLGLKALVLLGKKIISKMALFQNIEFMPPQKRITTFLDTAASYFKQQLPTDFVATV
jgi:hypothetical protein